MGQALKLPDRRGKTVLTNSPAARCGLTALQRALQTGHRGRRASAFSRRFLPHRRGGLRNTAGLTSASSSHPFRNGVPDEEIMRTRSTERQCVRQISAGKLSQAARPGSSV